MNQLTYVYDLKYTPVFVSFAFDCNLRILRERFNALLPKNVISTQVLLNIEQLPVIKKIKVSVFWKSTAKNNARRCCWLRFVLERAQQNSVVG